VLDHITELCKNIFFSLLNNDDFHGSHTHTLTVDLLHKRGNPLEHYSSDQILSGMYYIDEETGIVAVIPARNTVKPHAASTDI
jgi:hypothetical protein